MEFLKPFVCNMLRQYHTDGFWRGWLCHFFPKSNACPPSDVFEKNFEDFWEKTEKVKFQTFFGTNETLRLFVAVVCRWRSKR